MRHICCAVNYFQNLKLSCSCSYRSTNPVFPKSLAHDTVLRATCSCPASFININHSEVPNSSLSVFVVSPVKPCTDTVQVLPNLGTRLPTRTHTYKRLDGARVYEARFCRIRNVIVINCSAILLDRILSYRYEW